jgi:3-dehydroquinate synthase
VWLVGMMGAGKSTVGRGLARRLGRRFVDTDLEVERSAGASVAEIFAREGEPAFRRREREAIEHVDGGAVVALGGGAIQQPGAREHLAGTGTVVYLRARPETLLARVGDPDSRPLLAGLAPERRLERLRELLAERRAAYESASIVLDTDAIPAAEVIEALAQKIEGESR